ncbi:MAG TPA: HYR domain-containing protein [Vicinamibacterales bacterium]|nr:HYR domain-containing protein [Vicinamibacterales bacterium]
MVAAAVALGASAFAQSSPTATRTQWDLFTATGGNSTATRNVASIIRDADGVAGPAGSVWVAAQNPEPRIGRLDPSADSYVEWRPLVGSDYSAGAPLGMAINPSNGDVWVATQGVPSFLLKLGGTNTFRRFDAESPLAPQGVAVAPDGSLYAALPVANSYGQGRAIVRIPRNTTSNLVTATLWRFDQSPVGEPTSLALDSSGRLWFTDRRNNVVGRLDPAANTSTEWVLPAGSNPVGLHFDGSTVCVVGDGQIENAGVVQCLDPASNQVTRFAPPDVGLDRPQQLTRNRFGELFVTEWNGDSVVFIGSEAIGAASVSLVTPQTRSRPRSSIDLAARTITVAPIQIAVTPTVFDVTGTVVAAGQTRFALPLAQLTYPFVVTGHPQPFGVTAAFNDFERGSGTAYVGEYFSGPRGTYAAGRISKIEVIAPRRIVVSPASLTFDATIGEPAPAALVAITEANGLSLNWTAVANVAWLALSPSSGSAPASMEVTVNPAGLSAGTYEGVITIDDGVKGADPVSIPVTLDLAEAGPDTTPPELLLPADIVAEATGPTGATVSYSASATDDRGGTVPVNCSPASGSVFQLATTTVTCSASDTAGNTASRSFTVTVQDTTAPALTLPPDIAVTTSAPSVVVTYSPAPSATDLVDGSVAVTCSPPSGSSFMRGTTTVVCTATDKKGNTASGSFTVTVSSPTSFSVSPASLYFKTGRLAYCNGIAVGPNWKDQGLTITNTGPVTLNYSSSTATPWIRVPAPGSVAVGASVVATVSVDISGLSQGIYHGALTITGNGEVSTVVPVTLEIGNAAPTLCLTPTSVTWGSVKSSTTLTKKSFDITNVGDEPMGQWSATKWVSDGSLSLSASKGSAPSTVTITVKTGRKKGNQSGKVSVSVSGAVNGTQTIDLSWTVQ